VALNIGAGLSKGAAQELEKDEEQFRQRQTAYQEFLDEVQRYNRELKQQRAEADFERRMNLWEQRADAAREAADDRRENILDRREHERRVEREYLEDRLSEGESDGQKQSSRDVPAYEAIPVRTSDGTWRVWEMKQGEPVNRHDGLSEQRAQELTKQLNQRKGQQRRGASPRGGGNGAPADTTGNGGGANRRGRAVPADTSDAPAGGRSTPAGTESPSGDLGMVEEIGRIARETGPVAAIDRVEQLHRRGELSDAQAIEFVKEIERRFSSDSTDVPGVMTRSLRHRTGRGGGNEYLREEDPGGMEVDFQ
jgi:hypothetical protein